jgi:hypothetical protein
VTGGWRKLHSEELHNLYSSPSIIRMFKSRRLRWAGHAARMGRKLMHARRWEDNIKLGLREIGCGDMDWIYLAQDGDEWRTLVNTVMNLRIPWNAGKFLSSCTIGSFSRRAQLHEWRGVPGLGHLVDCAYYVEWNDEMSCSRWNWK